MDLTEYWGAVEGFSAFMLLLGTLMMIGQFFPEIPLFGGRFWTGVTISMIGLSTHLTTNQIGRMIEKGGRY